MPQFEGYCRDKNNDFDLLENSINASSPTKCHGLCKSNSSCTAFVFGSDDEPENCFLYQGGPYVHGEDVGYNQTCYSMSTGNFCDP